MSYCKRSLPIGDKFNKLTLIEDVPTLEKGRRYVYCLCECGSKKVLRWDMVKSGGIKSCGCLSSVRNAAHIEKMVVTRRRNREKVIIANYIGKRFHKLVVQSVYHHSESVGTWFTLKCDCGNSKNASLRDLKREHVQSCGCAGMRKYAINFVSEIDGENILVSKGKKDKNYLRVSESRELLHIYEAKKAYRLAGIEWDDELVIHHIDGNKMNNALSNLAIMENNSTHVQHHSQMERAMYAFLSAHNLLKDFYKHYPDLQLNTLKGLV